MQYDGITCPHCGHETGIEPALVDGDAPMQYCPGCNEPLFNEPVIMAMEISKPRPKVLGKMQLKVVNPEAPVFSDAIGITEDRKAALLQELNEQMEKLKGQQVRTCEIISEIVALCNNLEEVVYCTMCHTNFMAQSGNPY